MSCGTNDPMPNVQGPISPLSAAEISTLMNGILAGSSASIADTRATQTALRATLHGLREWCGATEIDLATTMTGAHVALGVEHV